MSTSTKPLRLRVPGPLKDKLELIAADLGCSVNAYAIRALAQVARNHVPLEDFINQAPTRGVGKARKEVGTGKLSRYDTTTCHPCGWPLNLPAGFWQMGEPEDKVENLRSILQSNRTFARSELNTARVAALLPAVSDDQWAETKAWFAANPASA